MTTLSKFLESLYADKDNTPSYEKIYTSPVATPSPGLNWALQGGVVPGGLYCFEGPESSGKSFMALACVAEMLRKEPEGVAIWFDVENAFSTHWVNILLPDPEDQKRLIVRRKSPMFGPDIFDWFKDVAVGWVQDGVKIVACVVDSLNAITAPKEANLKSSADHLYSDLAAYLPKALRLIAGPSKPKLKRGFEGITWFFISQVRDNMDPAEQMRGEKYTIPGGRAFKHALDTEILFEKIEAKKDKIFDETVKNMNESSIQIGHRVRAKVKKNKLGPPARIVEFDIIYDEGIVNKEKEVVDLAICLGVLTKDGNTYKFSDDKVAVGREKTMEAILNNADLYNAVYTKILETSQKETDEESDNR